MIYLFCNRTYGRPFLESAHRFLKEHGTDVSVVLSLRATSQGELTRFRELKRRTFLSIEAAILSRTIGAPVLLIHDVNVPDFLERIRPQDHGVIAGFNQIFGLRAIERFASLVNFHPSLLPFYRGPVPSYWCIRNGERKTGYTLHTVTPKIDSGEILFQEEVHIMKGDTPERLDNRIALLAAVKLHDYLTSVSAGQPFPKMCVDAKSLYSHHVNYASFPEKVFPGTMRVNKA